MLAKPKAVSDAATRLQQTRHKLMNIFIFYASFGDRNNYRLLKIQNFRRMLLDSQICRSEEQGKHYDIMYYQNKNKTGLTFAEFVDMLPKLAQSHYAGSKLTRKELLLRLMNEHLLVLEEYIMTKTELAEDMRHLHEPYESRSFEVLLRVKPVLEKIYREYFPSENIQDRSIHEKSFQSLLEFLREFELCPGLITGSVAFLAYEHLTNSEAEHASEQKFELLEYTAAGKEFTFKRFIKMLIAVALIGNKKISLDEESQPRKVVRLLERMEISAGFTKIERSIQTSQLSRTSMLIPEEVILDIEGGRIPSANYFSAKKQHHQRFATEGHQSEEHHISRSSSPGRETSDMLFLPEEELLIRKFHRELRAKFELYCSFGDTLNTNTLKSIKISKILREIGVLSVFSQAQLDLIISNLARFSQSGKIEYPQFLKLLCELSKKANIDLGNLIECIIAHEGANKEYARKVEERIQRTSIGQQNPHVYTLLNEIEKPLRMYYDYYTGGRGMSFSQFSKFMYDFEIFPFLISKPRLFSIFNDAAIQMDKGQKKDQSFTLNVVSSPKNFSSVSVKPSSTRHSAGILNEKYINFELFKECLGLCSHEIQETRLEDVERLLLLLQRMNDSKGPKLVTKALGNTRNAYGMKTDFLAEVRRKYSYFYEKDLFQPERRKPEPADFDSVFLG